MLMIAESRRSCKAYPAKGGGMCLNDALEWLKIQQRQYTLYNPDSIIRQKKYRQLS